MKNVIVITGASSGFGALAARALSLVARNDSNEQEHVVTYHA